MNHVCKNSAVFFGTREFAATILKGLIDSPVIDIRLVLTQPDRPAGRTQAIEAPPVKIMATNHGLQVEQPPSLKTYALPKAAYDIGITAEYGLLIPKHVLESPRHGILNVHTSLLPKYRGASPIQSAILNGDTETGVTIMKIDVGLDTGPILLQKKIPIHEHESFGEVEKKLAQLGVSLLYEAIPAYIDGRLVPVPQEHDQATACRELTRRDGQIDWQKSSTEIYNQYRALAPWPGVWSVWQGKRVKFLEIEPLGDRLPPGAVRAKDGTLLVGCAGGSVEIKKIQLEGKKAMSAADFIHGYGEELEHAIFGT